MKRYQKSAQVREAAAGTFGTGAVRCNLARVLLKEDFRGVQRAAGRQPAAASVSWASRGLDAVVVPSKSSLQRYEQWLPENEVRAVVERLLQLAAQPGKQSHCPLSRWVWKSRSILDVCFLDMTCVKANIHWPADWVLLASDAVQTLMAAVELIRREGLRHRMDEPKTFLTRINRLWHRDGPGPAYKRAEPRSASGSCAR